MDLNTVLDHLVVPVVVIEDPSRSALVAEGLATGGLPVAEVTFRTEAAARAIATMAEDPDFLVGAGTVVTPDQVDRAVEAGARFIVSPGLSRAVVERARHHDVPVLPAVVTPTEIMAGLDLGLDTFKFFPAGTFGGASALAALHGPFPTLRFMPTGGVRQSNLSEFLALPYVPAVGGTWLTPADADRKTIAERAARAVDAARQIKENA